MFQICTQGIVSKLNVSLKRHTRALPGVLLYSVFPLITCKLE